MKSLASRLAAYKARDKAQVFRSAFRQPGWRNGDGGYAAYVTKEFGLGGEGNRRLDEPNTWYSHSNNLSFIRNLKEAHKVINLRHTGWYADNHMDMLYVGVVAQLAGHKGDERWLAGYEDKEAGNYTFDLSCTYDEASSAAYAADSMAEHDAEESRDFYAKDAAERDIAEARAEIHQINQEALKLLREAKGKTFTPAVCSAVKAAMHGFLADRQAQFKIIADREHDYWSAVPNC